MLIDMHNHTIEGSPDSELTRHRLLSLAKDRGLDGVCLTEHDVMVNQDECRSLGEKYNMLVIGGIECSNNWGLLCFGIKPKTGRKVALLEAIKDLSMDMEKLQEEEIYRLMRELPSVQKIMTVVSGIPTEPWQLINMVHATGGIVYWAHPFSHSYLELEFNTFVDANNTLSILDFVTHIKNTNPRLWWLVNNVDGFEVKNGLLDERGIRNMLSLSFADTLGKSKIGGSDAHRAENVGIAATRIEKPVTSEDDWIDVMRKGNVEAVYLK